MMPEEEPRFAPNGNRLPERLPIGHRLVDTTKQQWLIGPPIGCGGFGDIYLAKQYNETTNDLKSEQDILEDSKNWTNVIKFEHFSGPLFAEINFYLRCARQDTIEDYMAAKKLNHLGMPRFISSGIYDPLRSDNPKPICKIALNGVKAPAVKRGRQSKAMNANGLANGKKIRKYRFLVLQRFGEDLEKIWTRAKGRFDMKSAFNIALKVIDTLEYIHSHGYVHADVKASNLLLEWSVKSNSNDSVPHTNGITNGKRTSRAKKRPQNGVTKAETKTCIEPDDQIYLIDFGLVERFLSKDGTHRENVEDQRRANNGTVEFSSRDAHIGAFSRRSDLESLAYNLLYWVSGGRLPWTNILKDHAQVEASKKWNMANLETFVNYCFEHPSGKPNHPSSNTVTSSIMCTALYDLLNYISKLGFEDEPDYHLIKSILTNAMGDGKSARTGRKRTGTKLKTTPPKLSKCDNPTPAMREIIRKISMNGKK